MKKPNIQVWNGCATGACKFNGVECSHCGHEVTQKEADAYYKAVEHKRGPGAPKKENQEFVKVGFASRMPRWLKARVKADPEPQTIMIEKAICLYKGWTPPG